jgi:hypothetical protein
MIICCIIRINNYELCRSLKEDMRLVVLRSLSEMPTYRSNSSVLHSFITRYGHGFSDQLRTELHWLAEQGLLEIEENLEQCLL